MKKMSLSQLSFIKERISDELKKNYIGGGYGTIDSPYTWNEYQDFLYNGNSSLPAFYFDETDNRQRHEGHSFGADPNWHQDGYPLNLDISRYLNLDLYLDDIKRNDPNFTLDQPIYFYGGTVLVGGVEVLSREDAIALVKSLYSGGTSQSVFDSNIDKFAKMAKMSSPEVYKAIGGVVSSNYREGANACALRISCFLNAMGLNISLKDAIRDGDVGSGDIDRDNKKEFYFYRADAAAAFIEKKLEGKFVEISSIEDIEGKKGFVYYTRGDWDYNNSGRHIDVWDGEKVIGKDYSSRSKKIYFFQFKNK